MFDLNNILFYFCALMWYLSTCSFDLWSISSQERQPHTHKHTHTHASATDTFFTCKHSTSNGDKPQGAAKPTSLFTGGGASLLDAVEVWPVQICHNHYTNNDSFTIIKYNTDAVNSLLIPYSPISLTTLNLN